MILRLLIDQDLDHDILRGLIRRIPNLDAPTALNLTMSAATDSELLARAGEEGRIIVTHDRKTMPLYAAELISAGKDIAGLIIVPRRMPLGEVLDDLELIITCSEPAEWINGIRYLPL